MKRMSFSHTNSTRVLLVASYQKSWSTFAVDNWEQAVAKAGKGLAVKQSKVQEIRHDEL